MQRFAFKNLSIFKKLLNMVLFAILPLFLIFAFYVIPTVSNKYMEDKQNGLQSVVESAYTLLDYYNKKANSGELTLDEAQDKAIDEINALRYSGKEYYFMYDLDGNNMALGSAPDKRGENWLNKKDKHGNMFIKEMVDASRKNGEGFIKYFFPKLGESEASPKLSYVKHFKPWNCFLGSGVYIDDVEANIADFKQDLYISFLLASLVAIGVGFVVARTISKPLKEVQESADKAAAGDLNVSTHYESTDEIGKLSKAFTIMVNNIRSQMIEVENKSNIAEEAMLESEKAKKEIEYQQNYLTENTELLLTEMDKFAKGNLSVNLESADKEPLVKSLFDGFNGAVRTMKETIAQVNESVLSTATAAAQISSSAEEMAAGAQEQSTQTSEVAAAIEEMSITISETTKHVVETNQVAKVSRNLAQSGQETIEGTISGMQKIADVVENASEIISELGNSSEQIGEIVQVINDIADQTNLLALNAAIEAARAGEQGRGFSVVADEVRKLAERTTKATNEIEDMIKKIQYDSKNAVEAIMKGNEEVSSGMEEATKAGGSMNEIVTSSDKVLEISTQVAAASEEQSTAVEEISRSVDGINSISQEAAIGVQQIAGAATNLSHLADGLKDLVSQFKFDQASNYSYQNTATQRTYQQV